MFYLGEIRPFYYRVRAFAAGAEDDGRDTGSREQRGIHPACAANLFYFMPRQALRVLQDGLYDGFLQRDFKWLACQASFDCGLKGRVLRGYVREDGGEFGLDLLYGFAGGGTPFDAQDAEFGLTRKFLTAFVQ